MAPQGDRQGAAGARVPRARDHRAVRQASAVLPAGRQVPRRRLGALAFGAVRLDGGHGMADTAIAPASPGCYPTGESSPEIYVVRPALLGVGRAGRPWARRVRRFPACASSRGLLLASATGWAAQCAPRSRSAIPGPSRAQWPLPTPFVLRLPRQLLVRLVPRWLGCPAAHARPSRSRDPQLSPALTAPTGAPSGARLRGPATEGRRSTCGSASVDPPLSLLPLRPPCSRLAPHPGPSNSRRLDARCTASHHESPRVRPVGARFRCSR